MFEYLTVKEYGEAEFIEKKSRFIGYIMPVKTEEEAVSFINKIKSKHFDATHNVYAYVMKDNNIRRYSDDGEPSGTAGVPVLDVILKENLVDVCVVVTRYFGGTLLGAGGLVRAYSKSSKIAIDAGKILKKSYCFQYDLKFEYDLFSKIKSTILDLNCILGEIEYTNEVLLKCYVPYNITNFTEKITDISNGRAIIKKSEDGKFVDCN